MGQVSHQGSQGNGTEPLPWYQNLSEPKAFGVKNLPINSELHQLFEEQDFATASVHAADLESVQNLQPLNLESASTLSVAIPTDREAASPLINQSFGGRSTSPWRLQVAPNFFIPLEDGGEDFSESVNYSLRFEAWNLYNNVILFIEPAYLERGLTETVSLDVPASLQNQVSSQFQTELDSQYFTLDVGLGYRFFEQSSNNPLGRTSEFDLPPVSFDILAGARVIFSWNDVTATSNLGQTATASRQQTWAEPLVGGRLRWNVSDQVALLFDGEVSGFGIGDLSFSWKAGGAVDWKFAGNTSLLAGYQVSGFDYTLRSGGNSLRYDMLSHGPYLSVLFRF